MVLRLYDTLTRKKHVFGPADPERVTLYVCGPTVYNYAHIGNARPAVVFDVLFRLLRRDYGEDHVVYARNVTDVDDKINAKAAAEGVDIGTVAERFTRIYNADIEALGVLAPTIEPRATRQMPEIIAMIARLVASAHAYEAEGHVLFAVSSFDHYGEFSRRNRDEQIDGARVEVAPYKRDPADFVLWKPSRDGEPAWESPWGKGRPGWHIECSAMAAAHLGETIDIHGGGLDLVFPHHENEIAQSTCAHGGAPFARFWVHNGMLNMADEKMSKSVGNVALIHDLLKDHPGEVLRLALLTGHYRAPLEFSARLLKQARATLDGWYRALRRLDGVEANDAQVPAAVFAALEDDLNTPEAIAAISALASKANKADAESDQRRLKSALLAAGGAMGLLSEDPEAWFQDVAAGEGPAPEDIERLLAERDEARAAKNFARADEIRHSLLAQGVAIEDGPDGATWRRTT